MGSGRKDTPSLTLYRDRRRKEREVAARAFVSKACDTLTMVLTPAEYERTVAKVLDAFAFLDREDPPTMSPVERWREMFEDDGLSIKDSEARLRASYSVAHFLASDDAVERIARKLADVDGSADASAEPYRTLAVAAHEMLCSIALSEESGHG